MQSCRYDHKSSRLGSRTPSLSGCTVQATSELRGVACCTSNNGYSSCVCPSSIRTQWMLRLQPRPDIDTSSSVTVARPSNVILTYPGPRVAQDMCKQHTTQPNAPFQHVGERLVTPSHSEEKFLTTLSIDVSKGLPSWERSSRLLEMFGALRKKTRVKHTRIQYLHPFG